MFKNLNGHKLIIGLVHLKPLPGTPLYEEGMLEASIEKALSDTAALIKGGADGCLIQSVDKIYPSGDDTDYARVAGMSVIVREVRKMAGPDFKIGCQLMWNCITPSLAIAKVCGADFTRCTALVGTTSSPFGTIEANPLKVQTYRNSINAKNVAMIAEVSGYHFHAGAYDKSLIQTLAKNAMTSGGADAVEVMHGDEEINNRMVQDIKAFNPSIPVVLGGGTNVENCARRLLYADAALVGSAFENGNWGGPIDAETVKRYVDNVRRIEK